MGVNDSDLLLQFILRRSIQVQEASAFPAEASCVFPLAVRLRNPEPSIWDFCFCRDAVELEVVIWEIEQVHQEAFLAGAGFTMLTCGTRLGSVQQSCAEHVLNV